MTCQLQTIRTHVEDGVAWVTLNRPDKLNAFVPEMGAELLAVYEQFNLDDSVRAVVLTGAGRGFCAGLDREVQQDAARLREMGEARFLREFAPLIHAYRKPTIAAINGPAAGIGVTAILGFDLLLMARSARLVLPFAAMKISPGMGATHYLPRRVGLGRALEMLMLGEPVDAQAALASGLVNRLADDEKLADMTRTFAVRFAALGPAVLCELRAALAYGADASFTDAVAREQWSAGYSASGLYPPSEPYRPDRRQA